MNKFDSALEHDGVQALRALGVTDDMAALLIAHMIYSARMRKYPLPLQCIWYVLDNFNLCAKDIAGYKISCLFFCDPDHGETKFHILQALVSKGYKVEEYGLYNALGNKPVLEYLFDLPEDSWIYGVRTNRVPFLVNRMMHDADPSFFTQLLHRYLAPKSKEERKHVLNLTPVGVMRNPLQTISTFYGARNTCKILPHDMPRAIQTAKLLIDHGADPFHISCILREECEKNPQLAMFMESYAHQIHARQMLQDLLRVEKQCGMHLPFDVLVHTCTQHMRPDNPYNVRFIEHLYTRHNRNSQKHIR